MTTTLLILIGLLTFILFGAARKCADLERQRDVLRAALEQMHRGKRARPKSLWYKDVRILPGLITVILAAF